MKIYTIASEVSKCYGHGDYGTEQTICRDGAYGSGSFPPAFKTRESAEDYLKGIEWNYGKVVVEMQLND
jgi:hypothetical protein